MASVLDLSILLFFWSSQSSTTHL